MLIYIIISLILSSIFIILYKNFLTMKNIIESKNNTIIGLESSKEVLLTEISILKEKLDENLKSGKIKVGSGKKYNKKNIAKYSDIHVLIVDYIVESSLMTKRVLEDFGLNVDIVRNINDTETILNSKKDHYSIIFTNNILRNSSGEDILKLAKNINENINVVLTTVSHLSELQGVIEFDGYLQKNINHEEVDKLLKILIK